MKHLQLSFTTLALMLLNFSVMAQTSYSINSSANWSAALPSTCYACTINIGSSAVLTVDGSDVCQNCVFNGGTVAIASKTLNIQYAGSQTTTYFNGTSLQASGTAKVIVNAPLSLSNATFTFNNTSSMTTSYEVDLTNSTIDLFDNSAMTSNGGSSTTINLLNNSHIVIGNGSSTSSSIFTVSGPTMNIYGSSSVTMGNANNVYYNWAGYNYYTSTTATAKSNSTLNTAMNCGSGYSHSCSNPYLYGPASVAASVTGGSTLPVLMDGFTAALGSDHTILLEWNTQMEINFSHFLVQRSADGLSWEDVGTVQAKGNSAVRLDYSFRDRQPLAGVNYYRLALVNLDNSYTYTEVKVMQVSAIAKMSFFPNPAREYVNVSLGGSTGNAVTVLLVSVSGQVMEEKKAVTGNGEVVSLPVQNIAAGMYVLTVVGADGSRESSPMMINRF